MKTLSRLVVLLLLAACRQEEMRTFRVPKEQHPALVSGEGMMGTPADSTGADVLPPGHPDISGMAGQAHPPEFSDSDDVPHVQWKTPSGWVEKPGTGFRYATFVVPGPDRLSGDLSITILSGEAGGLLGNVNRWRGQLGLPPLPAGEISAHTRTIRPSGRTMTLASCVSTDNLIDGKYKKQILAAVYSSPGNTWFFKLTGEDRLVRSAEPDFLKFLESLKGL